MELDHILRLIRPLVAVVDGVGCVRQAYGGCGGFLGYEPDAFVGRNVLEFVAPADHHDVASYFVGQLGDEVRTTLLPLPFRTRVVAADGSIQSVDVIATGRPDDPDIQGWLVVMVPIGLMAGVSRSLDAELAGAAPDEVKRLLAAELEVDNVDWTTRMMLVDLTGSEPHVIGSPSADPTVLSAVGSAVATGWRPWLEIGRGVGEFDVSLVGAPDAVVELAKQGWNLFEAAPVMLDGEQVAAFIRVSEAVNVAPLGTHRSNVAGRFKRLVEVTRLLYGRWRDQARLLEAATTDPLTGLANRDGLHRAVSVAVGAGARTGTQSVVLYVDIDRFKEVNDLYGHAVGDAVLISVAKRIEASCRPGDTVARLGGDEFVVVLQDVTADEALEIGERMMASVGEPCDLPDGPPNVSISVGLAPVTSSSDPLDRADRAMLLAKRKGRGQIVSG